MLIFAALLPTMCATKTFNYGCLVRHYWSSCIEDLHQRDTCWKRHTPQRLWHDCLHHPLAQPTPSAACVTPATLTPRIFVVSCSGRVRGAGPLLLTLAPRPSAAQTLRVRRSVRTYQHNRRHGTEAAQARDHPITRSSSTSAILPNTSVYTP